MSPPAPSNRNPQATPTLRRGLTLPAPVLVVLAAAGLALLGVLVYVPGLHGGFVFDDFNNIVDQPALAPQALQAHFWQAVWAGQAGPFGRVLSMLSFAWQIRVWGLSPAALKLFNLLLHLGNGLLVGVLSWRVFGWVHARQLAARPASAWVLPPRVLALLVTAAWLLAPIQVTAVLYVVQREESLAALFVLLGLLGYWHGRMELIRAVRGGTSQRKAWVWMVGGLLGATVLAALSKETGVMLPAYAAVLEWVVLRGDMVTDSRDPAGSPALLDARCRLLGVFALLLVLPGLLGLAWLLPGLLHGAYSGRPFTLAQRLLTEGRVMVDYLHWIVLPSPDQLSLYHDDFVVSTGWLRPWTTAACWALLMALLGAGLALRRRQPLVSLGSLWFFAGQSLVSTVVPLELVYEHRNYLPAWGVFVAGFGLLGAWTPRRVAGSQGTSWGVLAGTLCVGLVALYAGFTAMRAQVWGNPYRLAYFEATTHPRSPRANYDLGRTLYILASGPDSTLFQLATRQMLAAARLPDADMQPMQALVFMHAKAGLPVDAAWWAELRRQLRSQPVGAENTGALYSLVQCGVNHVCRYSPQDLRELGGLLDAGVQAHPDSAGLLTLRASFEANVVHAYPAAYQDMLRAVALDPSGLAYWANLVQLQIAGGQLAQAAAGLNRMRELDPFGLHSDQRTELQRQIDAARAKSRSQP